MGSYAQSYRAVPALRKERRAMLTGRLRNLTLCGFDCFSAVLPVGKDTRLQRLPAKQCIQGIFQR